jgi:hypothetical protein
MRAQRIARVFRKMDIDKKDRKSAIEILNASLKAFNNGKTWIQEDYLDGKGGYCAIGAVEKFAPVASVAGEEAAISALILALPDGDSALGHSSLSDIVWHLDGRVIDFNDKEGRKFSSIKTLFNRAKNGLKLSLTSEK